MYEVENVDQCKRYDIKEYDNNQMNDLAKLIEEARINSELKEEILNLSLVESDRG